MSSVSYMMTSSNGNIFRVTGPLCGDFTGPGEFPAQRPVTRSFDVFFDLRLNKRLSKQPWGWWFETPAWSLWRHRNDLENFLKILYHGIPWHDDAKKQKGTSRSGYHGSVPEGLIFSLFIISLHKRSDNPSKNTYLFQAVRTPCQHEHRLSRNRNFYYKD